jgi:hypothetical protein
VDARLHRMQRETEGMNAVKQSELLDVLGGFAAERLALVERHEANARVVSHYDFNNTYQYIINREETHLTWLRSALDDQQAPFPGAAANLALPAPEATRVKGDGTTAFRDILEGDARLLAAFVDRWRARVEALTHARHRLMLNVILGETSEHQRLFTQAARGFEDVLGRRTHDAVRRGSVLPVRWME